MASNFIGRDDLPLGLRNNNPGDERPGDAWQGMIGTNEGFVVFQDISWGIRAMATDLLNKIKKGENTIASIISIYAPPSENDTAKYISDVAADTGLDPNAPLPLDTSTLHSLIRAIMNKELGGNYSQLVMDADIDQGIGMVSNGLLSLLQAAGIAIESAVNTATGSNPPAVDGSGVLMVVGAGILALLLIFTRKK